MHLRLTMALKFMRSRRKGALTRFISFASTSGIALGVFAALVGLSAMNGFESELSNRVLSIIPSAQLNSGNESFKDAAKIEMLLADDPRIVASAPAIEQRAILVANQTFLPVNLVGIDPRAESKVVALQNFIDQPLTVLEHTPMEPRGTRSFTDSTDLYHSDRVANSDKLKSALRAMERGEATPFTADANGLAYSVDVPYVHVDNADRASLAAVARSNLAQANAALAENSIRQSSSGQDSSSQAKADPLSDTQRQEALEQSAKEQAVTDQASLAASNAALSEVENNNEAPYVHAQAPISEMSEQALANVPLEVRESILHAQSVEKEVREQASHIPHIILGAALARKLNVKVGDTLEIFTLNFVSNQDSSTDQSFDLEYGKLKQVLQAPQKSRAEVVGILKIGGQLDSLIALMHISQLQSMVGLQGPNSIHIRTNDINATQKIVVEATSGKITENAYLTTWLSTHGKLYHDIQMVRQIMFLAMFLVLAVACFNIISNLMMMVGEKRREIAILLTMGMTPREIIATFSLMGMLSGGYGALIGVILGVPVSLLLTPVTSHFKEWFGFDLLNPDVYFINFIPCSLEWLDLITIIAVALCMSLGAALYPAYRAAHVKPAQELNL